MADGSWDFLFYIYIIWYRENDDEKQSGYIREGIVFAERCTVAATV